MTDVRTRGEIENYLGDTIVSIAYIRKHWDTMQTHAALIPEMQREFITYNASTRIIADAMAKIAKTDETRRTDYKELVVDGRESIPKDLVYYMIKWICLATSIPCFVLSGCVVIGMLYFTNYKLAAAVQGAKIDLQIGQNEIREKVSSIPKEINSDAKERTIEDSKR